MANQLWLKVQLSSSGPEKLVGIYFSCRCSSDARFLS